MNPGTRGSVVDAMMALLAERHWNEVSLEAIAERAGTSLHGLRSEYDGRIAILREFTRAIDEAVLEGRDPHMAGEAVRERLFDILYSRIEALTPHKPAIRNLAGATRRDPLLALELNRMVSTSMNWMLAAAGLRATGAAGALQAQGLALVWSHVLRTWLGEDDPTLPRTMAELDRQLRRSERAVKRASRLCGLLRRDRSGARTAPPPQPYPPAGDVAEAHPS